MERVTTLLSRGWWFDPQCRQSEKLLSGRKFMASHQPPLLSLGHSRFTAQSVVLKMAEMNLSAMCHSVVCSSEPWNVTKMLQSYNDILLPPSFEKMPSSATCHMSPLDKKRGTRNSLSQPRWIGTMPPSAICWFLHRNGMGRVGILVPREVGSKLGLPIHWARTTPLVVNLELNTISAL